MVRITREEKDALDKAGLLRNGSERNFQITSKRKRKGGKSYFLTEDFEQLAFLGLYDKMFLDGAEHFNKMTFLDQWIRDRKVKRISFYQLKEMQKKHNELRVQEEGQHLWSAEAFIFGGAVYIRTIPYLMQDIQAIPFKRPTAETA